MRVLVSALLLAAAALGQTAPTTTQPPTFRSGRDLLTVDAFVRDGTGQPVTDLQAADFVLKIDGQPRPVLAVRMFGNDAARVTNAAAPIPRFIGADTVNPGRVVVLVIDRDSLRPGGEKAAIATAARLIEGLSAADAVGLLTLPAGGVDLTRDHAAVAAAVRMVTGTMPATMWQHDISWDEALAYDHQDTNTIRTVVERECSSAAAQQRADLELPQNCPPELERQAREMLLTGHEHADRVITRLSELLGTLAPLRAPRHVVFLSGGLPFDVQLLTRYNDLAMKAAQAHVGLSVVHLDQPSSDTGDRKSLATVYGGREYETGVATIASMTGGSFYMGVGRAAGVFDRIATDVNSFYELGVERRPSDDDGKLHRVEIAMTRPGLTVRTARQTAVERTGVGGTRSIERALMQPTDVADLPLELGTFVMHGVSPAEVRVLLRARLSDPSLVPAEWGYMIFAGNTEVARARHVVDDAPAGQPWGTTAEVRLPPGRYRVRFGVTDAAGRVGVLDLPLMAGLRTSGAVALSDLVVGTSSVGQVQPTASVRQGDPAVGFIELSSNESLATVSGTLEIIPAGAAQAALRLPLRLAAREDDPTVVLAQTRIDADGLAPGTYTAAAVMARDDQPFARVSRVFTVAAGDVSTVPAVASGEPAPAGEPVTAVTRTALAAVMSRVARYVTEYGDKASLLVCVETYNQRTAPAPVGQPGGRRLVSEYALVKGSSAWSGFRDVVEVDGKPVSDRRDRLERLFRDAAPDLAAARRIADESARYNIGGIKRNFNVPTAALFFFTTADVRRFAFERLGETTLDGLRVWEVGFKEIARPTLIRTTEGRDVPAHGSIWIDPETGAVVRTQMFASGFIDASTTSEVDVWYRRDPRLALWVPSSMRERLRGTVPITGLAQSRFGRALADVETTGTATYTDYKRFETGATIK